jgi:hypothetical protein
LYNIKEIKSVNKNGSLFFEPIFYCGSRGEI